MNLPVNEAWWPEKDGGERRQRDLVCFNAEADGGGPAIDRAVIAAAERPDGRRVLTSGDDTPSAEDMALGYNQLLRVERGRRTTRSGIEMRPVRPCSPGRVRLCSTSGLPLSPSQRRHLFPRQNLRISHRSAQT